MIDCATSVLGDRAILKIALTRLNADSTLLFHLNKMSAGELMYFSIQINLLPPNKCRWFSRETLHQLLECCGRLKNQ